MTEPVCQHCPHCRQMIIRSDLYGAILDAVSEAFGVLSAAIVSRFRSESVAMARHAVVHILRERHRMSYSEIGKILERDHTSIMNSYHVGLDLMKSDRPFKQKMMVVLDKLYGGADAVEDRPEPEGVVP